MARRVKPDLERTLREQAEWASVPQDLDVTVSLEAGDAVWTSRIEGGALEVAPGAPERPDVRVIADALTMAAVVSGARSGVEAFLGGDLRVRGNLSLALRLTSIFAGRPQSPRWPRWRSVRAGGLVTPFLEAGRGPHVVLLHGLGATNASFLTTVWELAETHHVIAPDLPGFGDASKPVRRYDATFYARWLDAFLDRLGIERASLVGNSMGGRVAIEAALARPDRIDRLALLAPAPAFLRRREFVRLVRVLRPELALVPVPVSHRNVVRTIRSLFSRPDRVPTPWFEAAADEFLRVFRSPFGRIAFFSAARQIYLDEPRGDDGFWERLCGLSRPALFVWGERDWLIPAKFGRHVQRAVPAATSVVLADCGHVPQYELPALTHATVREFLGTAA